MDTAPKFLTLALENLNSKFCAETEEAAIEQASKRVNADHSKSPVYIYKVFKVVRPRETPVVVEDLPE